MKSSITLCSCLLLAYAGTSQAVSFSEVLYTPSQNSTTIISKAQGISDDGLTVTGSGGEIIADFGNGGLTQRVEEAFQWNSGTAIGIGGTINVPATNTPPSNTSHQSTGLGASSNGTVIVGTISSKATRWVSGTPTDLDVLPGQGHTTSVANDVSDNGSIVVGNSFGAGVIKAFKWDGSMAELSPLGADTQSQAKAVSGDGSVIVGTSRASGNLAVSWTNSTTAVSLGVLSGGTTSSANGVSSDGATIVGESTSSNGVEAFRWTSAGGIQALGDLPGGVLVSSAKAASLNGSVIVGSGNTASGQEAFVWTATNGMQNLRTVLINNGQDLTGWTALTEATAISSDGNKIAGYGVKNGNTIGWVADITGTGLSSGVTNDFNGDGKSDIFWRHDVSNGNKIYFMNGNVISSEADLAHLTDPAWTVVGNSDFNGDGKSDVLWRHTSGANQIALMNGASVSSTVNLSIPTLTAATWEVGGIGDFDGDGNDDIFWHNNTTAENQITLMNGTAVVSTTNLNTIANGDTGWYVAGISDFNQDGKDDVIWRHDVNKRVWMYLMNGVSISNGGGGGEHVVFTAANWNIDGVGDFNGDGKGDILWRNSNNGRVWVYLMNGISVSNGNPPVAPGEHVAFTALVWKIKAIGDYNGDGKSDIFWRHSTQGWNHMYLMNGATPTLQADVNSLPDLNWKVK